MIYAEVKDGKVLQVWRNVPETQIIEMTEEVTEGVDDQGDPIIVTQVVRREVPFVFSPPLTDGAELVTFPDGTDVAPGMLYDGQTLAAPPVDLATARRWAKEHVRFILEEAGEALIAAYPRVEVDSWPVKVQAAQAIKAGTATADQQAMIDHEAALAGIDSATLVDTILAKAADYMTAAATLAGMRQKAYAAIDAAATEADIQAAIQAAEADAAAFMASVQ